MSLKSGHIDISKFTDRCVPWVAWRFPAFCDYDWCAYLYPRWECVRTHITNVGSAELVPLRLANAELPLA
jgi:hypothetical protein